MPIYRKNGNRNQDNKDLLWDIYIIVILLSEKDII